MKTWIDSLAFDLQRDEGFEPKPYKCTAGKLTIGYGLNLTEGITRDEAEFLLMSRIEKSLAELKFAFSWFDNLSENQKRGLVNMVYNIGLTRLMGFKKMLEALSQGNGDLAAKEALNSKWAKQVGTRANRIAKLLEG